MTSFGLFKIKHTDITMSTFSYILLLVPYDLTYTQKGWPLYEGQPSLISLSYLLCTIPDECYATTSSFISSRPS